jgi:hypothetical protein
VVATTKVALCALDSVTGEAMPLTPVSVKERVEPELFLKQMYLPILELGCDGKKSRVYVPDVVIL